MFGFGGVGGEFGSSNGELLIVFVFIFLMIMMLMSGVNIDGIVNSNFLDNMVDDVGIGGIFKKCKVVLGLRGVVNLILE